MGEINFQDFLERIQNPSPKMLDAILKAREDYQTDGREQYNIIKTTELPCYTLNFYYDKYKVDKNIKSPTGYIYLDLDNNTNLDFSNELIFASWRSLSNEGRGILVKVENLSIGNFKSTYTTISDALNIISDTAACKPSQFNVQSYDPDLYYNGNSIVWDTNTTNEGINKNTPISYIYKKKKEKDVNELGVKIRYNNLDEIDFNNNPFLVFYEEKHKYAEIVIPSKINLGSRNNILSTIAHQSYALNPNQTIEDFRQFIYKVNQSRCDIPLLGQEVEIIVQKTINKKELKPILNKERRLIFNPDYNLPTSLKNRIKGRVVGVVKKNKSKNKIEKGINNWNPKEDGKISQLRLAKKLGMSKNTINEYYKLFKNKIYGINTSYKIIKNNE